MNDTRRAVLAALDAGPVSGPELAESLDISRAAVWKHVEGLREVGFEVESAEEGYRLTDVPEFGGPVVELGLDAPFTVEYHDSIASTNDRGRELAATGATDVVVLADQQTGGRGRLDREWSSPSGGVWLSIVLRPDLPPSHAPLLTLAAAVAVTTAAREAGVDAGIKWPNDVLVPTADGERKLAGILTEMEGEADRVSWLIVGIGVNVNVDVAELPPEATSIAEHVGTIERRVFVQRLLETFDVLRDDPDSIIEAWEAHALTLGKHVRVTTPTGEVVGEAVGVESPGQLLVETDEKIERVHIGDCEHLRPMDP